MDPKKKLAATFVCVALAFVGVLHFVFSTVYGYGFRLVGLVLVAVAVFGLFVVNA